MISLKDRIESAFVMPLARLLRIDPNVITLFSILAMLLASAFVLNGNLYLGALFVFFSGYFDLLDGTVAKYHKRATRFGAFLDRVSDRINDMLVISAILLAGLVSLELGVSVLSLVILSSYASSVLESQSKTNVGEKLSLRGVRLTLIILGLIFNYIVFAFYLLFILSLFALFERINTARVVLR